MNLYLLELYKDFYNLFIIIAISFIGAGLVLVVPTLIEVAQGNTSHIFVRFFSRSIIIAIILLIIICFLPSPELINTIYTK